MKTSSKKLQDYKVPPVKPHNRNVFLKVVHCNIVQAVQYKNQIKRIIMVVKTETEFKAAAQIWLVPLKIVFNFSRLKPVFGRFETRLKLIKFGH